MVIAPSYLWCQIWLLTWGTPESTERTTIITIPGQETHQWLGVEREPLAKITPQQAKGCIKQVYSIKVKMKWNEREIKTREDEKNKHKIRVGRFFLSSGQSKHLELFWYWMPNLRLCSSLQLFVSNTIKRKK